MLAATATIIPKHADGPVEAIRALRVARLGAIKAKTAATNTLRAMLITAPESLRAQLPSSGLPNKIIDACARLRPDSSRLDDPAQATKAALRSIAQRARALRDEIKALDAQLAALVTATAPATLAVFAMGPDTAAALLVTVGDNPGSGPSAPSRISAASPLSPRPQARRIATDSTAAGTAPPTGPCTSR